MANQKYRRNSVLAHVLVGEPDATSPGHRYSLFALPLSDGHDVRALAVGLGPGVHRPLRAGRDLRRSPASCAAACRRRTGRATPVRRPRGSSSSLLRSSTIRSSVMFAVRSMQSICDGPDLVAAPASAIRPTVPAARPPSRSNQETILARSLFAPPSPNAIGAQHGLRDRRLGPVSGRTDCDRRSQNRGRPQDLRRRDIERKLFEKRGAAVAGGDRGGGQRPHLDRAAIGQLE